MGLILTFKIQGEQKSWCSPLSTTMPPSQFYFCVVCKSSLLPSLPATPCPVLWPQTHQDVGSLLSPVKSHFLSGLFPEQACNRERRMSGESEPERQDHSSEAAGPGAGPASGSIKARLKDHTMTNTHWLLTHMSFPAAKTADPELDLGGAPLGNRSSPLHREGFQLSDHMRKAPEGSPGATPSSSPEQLHPETSSSHQVPAGPSFLSLPLQNTRIR